MKDAQAIIRVRAHAKINLSLRVLGRREDGYHELRTVFQALALCDTLSFVARPGPFALECGDPRVPVDSTNLVSRAAERLWRHLGRGGDPRDVAVQIDKRIPMKAGLGGGSADAAAALLGFARLWDPELPVGELVAIGRDLGADVGFFFTGGAALGLGRGDEIYPLADLPRYEVLLVVPPFDVSTADAYRWLDESRGETKAIGESRPLVLPGCSWPSPACEIVNDFTPAIAARHPAIADVVAALNAAGARAAEMTGSGSTVFGLFDDQALAGDARRALEGSGHVVEATRTLSRREYLRASAPAPVPARARARHSS